MKLPTLALVAVVAVVSAVLTPQIHAATDDYDVCFDLKPGQLCKNPQGQDSRCSHRSVCIENLKECPSGSKLLQSCSETRNAYCFTLFDSKPLLCLDDVDIEAAVQRDVCTGKSDGTACTNAFAEASDKKGLTATVYEQDGVCEDSTCLATIFSSCDKVTPGRSCSHTAVLGGKRRSFTGNCEAEEPFRMWCKSSSNGVVLGDAKVLVAPAMSTSSATPSPSKTLVASRGSDSLSGTKSNSTKSSTDQLFDDLMAPFTPTPTPSSTSSPTSSSSTLAASVALSVAIATSTMFALLNV